MRITAALTTPLVQGLVALSLGIAMPVLAVDAEAAKALSKKEDCTKCHAPTKDKKGPSLKKISDKYKGKADAEANAIKYMNLAQKVKLDDGSEEDHPLIKAKDPAVQKNLAQWILSH